MTTSGNPGNTVPVEFELTSIAARLGDLLNYLDGSIDALLLDTLPLKTVITPLVKMYALVTQETGMATSPIAADVTDTEVVTLACALLRAQGSIRSIWPSHSPLGEETQRTADLQREKLSTTKCSKRS